MSIDLPTMVESHSNVKKIWNGLTRLDKWDNVYAFPMTLIKYGSDLIIKNHDIHQTTSQGLS